MKIHRVKRGESIYDIAKDYGVSAQKIVEDNAVLYPERLIVGEELLILTPTRTYTARKGDTLSSVSLRFHVKESDLLMKNPFLLGRRELNEGEVLSLKSDTPP